MPATSFQTCKHCFCLGLSHLIYLTSLIFPEDNRSKEQNLMTMQIELNYDLDPRALEREGGREWRKSECLCLFSPLHNSGAWELQQLGRALRNILSCNVNMSELWSSMALPPCLAQHSVQRVCQWHKEPTLSFPGQGNDPEENRLFEVLLIKPLFSEPHCTSANEQHGWTCLIVVVSLKYIHIYCMYMYVLAFQRGEDSHTHMLTSTPSSPVATMRVVYTRSYNKHRKLWHIRWLIIR